MDEFEIGIETELNDLPKATLQTSESSIKKKYPKKNKWTKSKVDECKRKMNNEIYCRKRQASVQIKLDDMALYINEKIQKRGIAKGLVCVQEALNLALLKTEQKTIEILMAPETNIQLKLFTEIERITKLEIWTAISFITTCKGLTPGETGELIEKQVKISEEFDKWKKKITETAISTQG